MNNRYIGENLRKEVEKRAKGICEYCRINIDDTYFGGEIDHIISLKHRGETVSENLAFACQPCNRNKGSDLGSISENTKELVRFYNPRTDDWNAHFHVNQNGEIETLSEIGEVTAFIFKFNEMERVLERQGLMELGAYPN
ncbi:MAG TPA: HNH endonuclease signature motif containing protein [Pyrinomonadaceae bacterium]|nr:HNH endonuclease signature motif containing protein [Pyrinomonadaceae bacterium]